MTFHFSVISIVIIIHNKHKSLLSLPTNYPEFHKEIDVKSNKNLVRKRNYMQKNVTTLQ